jgi:hypothetical protein
MAALMSTMLVYAVGVAVDYMNAVNFRTTLQSTVDAAALAGATAFTACTTTGPGSKSTAETVATNVFNATALPWHNGSITPTVSGSTTGVTCPGTGTPTAYKMTVTVNNVPVPTTFMSAIMSSMSVSATATAINPVVTVTFNAGGWGSSAYDANYIYEYPIPSDGSVPAFDASQMGSSTAPNVTVDNTFNFLFTNMNSTSNGTITISMPVSQKIGLMLYNVTGGRIHYGSGQYNGQSQGSAHASYSQKANPSGSVTTQVLDSNGNQTGSTSTNGGYTSGYNNHGSSTVQNCSLQVVTTFGNGTAVTASSINSITSANFQSITSPTTGNCYGNTLQTHAAQSCEQLNGQAVYYEWNDMGGGYDDYDYNDAEFGIYCGTGTGSPGTVHLIS